MASNGKNGSSRNGSHPENTWAGAGRRGDGKIRVAIVGVGNCASSLVQGRYYYENAKETDFVPGLMHVNLGGYHVRDIEFVAAFETLANLATRAGVEGARFRIHTPLILLSKADIIRRGLELGLDYGLTHSCYNPDANGRPCGRCDSCVLRARGFVVRSGG